MKKQAWKSTNRGNTDESLSTAALFSRHFFLRESFRKEREREPAKLNGFESWLSWLVGWCCGDQHCGGGHWLGRRWRRVSLKCQPRWWKERKCCANNFSEGFGQCGRSGALHLLDSLYHHHHHCQIGTGNELHPLSLLGANLWVVEMKANDQKERKNGQ